MPKLAFLDKQTYLDFLRQDDPNPRQAPNAHYDMGDNTIYVTGWQCWQKLKGGNDILPMNSVTILLLKA